MPSNSSGLSKHTPRIYSPGSGGYTTNHPSQDNVDEDPIRTRQWNLFSHENRYKFKDVQSMREAFNLKFGYV